MPTQPRALIMIPLVLLAGFLGAGKTRLLTTLVPQLAARGVRARIILNDFRNARIDAARLSELNALVTPLAGECVCCSSLRELLDLLYDTPPDPGSVLLIEANGATETDDLLGHLTTDGHLGHFTLPLQVTVVDAARWQKRWWHNGLEEAQVRTATHLVLNWLDNVAASRRDAVTTALQALNPRARVVTSDDLAAALHTLVEDVTREPARGGRVTASTDAPGARAHHFATPALAHGDRSHTHPFGSLALPLPAVVARDRFQAFVQALPESVVRAKGLVRFADRPAEMFVWNRVPGARRLSLDRSRPHDDATATALFIGVELPVATLREQIAALAD